MKRANFASIQQSHGIACKGGITAPMRTGYETVIAHRVDPLYAFTAKEDCRLVEVDEDHALIEYEDGTQESVQLGIITGVSEGSHIPQELICDLSPGKYKAGTVIAYNKGFFQRDFFDRNQVSWRNGVMVTTAMLESNDTLEDSCAISAKLGGELTSNTAKVRSVLVSFDQEIHNLVEVGDTVDLESILCIIEDSVTSNSGLFDEESLQTLSKISSNAPKAKFIGEVYKVDVIYCGDKREMSDTLRNLVNRVDRHRSRVSRKLRDSVPASGEVLEPVNIEGNKIVRGTALIQIHMKGELAAGVGDKAVFGNQLKTVIGRVFSGENRTESGEEIDALFSYSAVDARIVLSPEIMGTTNVLLKVISRKVAEAYRS